MSPGHSQSYVSAPSDGSPLISGARLVTAFGLAFLANLLDWQLLGLIGVGGVGELLLNTLVHGIGIYVGVTIAAWVNRPSEPAG